MNGSQGAAAMGGGGGLAAYLDDLLDERASQAAMPAPEGTGQRLEALVVEAGEVAFALPQAAVEAVLPAPGRLARPPRGAPAWLLGRLARGGTRVPVADLAAALLPPGRAAAGQRPWLVALAGGWALACDRVGDPVSLGRDQVRWRRPDGRRPWLAGVAAEPAALVLNPTRLTAWLDAAAGHGTDDA